MHRPQPALQTGLPWGGSHLGPLSQVRQRVRQIDCVTVKGSNRAMGLFTYDVTLERVAAPDHSRAPWPPAAAAAAAGQSRRSSMASSTNSVSLGLLGGGGTAQPADADSDVVSYSLSAYNWEFSDHPDLAQTWAVDEVFLDLFARVCIPLAEDIESFCLLFIPVLRIELLLSRQSVLG